MFSIGNLSQRTGVKIPTIRYYEQTGLLDKPGRTQGNQRCYTEKAFEKLCFVKHARDLGFSMEAIRDLLRLSAHKNKPCIDASRIACEQLTHVRDQIARLKRLEVELDRISSHCSNTSAEACYVLHALSNHALCKGEH